ncbi:MAG: adenine deaminase [Myxococcota bacterium]|jgi:adenine deaminase|nr:adenine deaminase [Myxococcota bacterium]
MADNFPHREAALGSRPADLLLANCRLVNVLSGRIEEGVSIAIAGNHVVGIGTEYEGAERIDLQGQYVYPGLMDAHIHLESSKLTIPECGRAMSRCGTTAVFADPHEIANVASLEGVSYQLDTASHNERLSVYFSIPSCVPAIPDPELETFASYMGPTKLRTFFNNPWFVSLGEMMNMPGAIYGDPKVLQKLTDIEARGLRADGHAPLLSGKPLNAYIYLGISSDHESTGVAEAQEKLDRGMYLMLREGSTESNLQDLLPLVNEHNSSRILLASDDLDPIDLAERGHLDHMLRICVANGVPAIRALQMATINVATYFRLSRHGAIFPGALADLVVAPDLTEFRPTAVMRSGRFVIRDGVELPAGRPLRSHLRSTMNADLPPVEALAVRAVAGRKLRCITAQPGQILTGEATVSPRLVDGWAQPDPAQDLAKICVFERHRNSGAFGVGFIQGLGLKRGAVGSSVCHDSHNIIVAGMDDESIRRAAERITAFHGGQVAVAGPAERVLPLPVAGLMSDGTFESVVLEEQALHDFCQEALGSSMKRLAAALSFMGLPVIPELKITDQGLVRVQAGRYPERVGVWVD